MFRRLLIFGLGALLSVPAPSGATPWVRLLDEPIELLPGGTDGRARVGEIHLPAGDERSIFVRGLTIHAGETLRFPLPAGGPARVRWLEGPAADETRRIPLRASVDGRPVRPRGEGPFRSLDVTGVRHFELTPAGPASVRVGEPFWESGAAPAPALDVLLVTVDTWRRDALSLHGGPPAATPRLTSTLR